MNVLFNCKVLRAHNGVQKGQALLESLIVALGMAVLWVAISWLAQYQDAALSATHASSYAAFVATRHDPEERAVDLVQPFFQGRAHGWKDRKGEEIVDTQNVYLHSSLGELSAYAQPGQTAPLAAALRRDWRLEEGGILHARVGLSFADRHEAKPAARSFGLRLDEFDRPYPKLERSTAILTGAGHSASDASVQTRVAESALAWSTSYGASLAAGRAAQSRASQVEEGWGRPAADFDWLDPWSGYVPEHLLAEYETNGRN